MRATVMYGVHDVRVQSVPDARLIEPTDALVRVTRACICGSDLWPYNSMPTSETGNRMGHEFIGVVESIGTAVRTVKKDDLVVAPFGGPMAPANSASRDCRRPACTADGGAAPRSTAAKARQYVCRRRTEPWWRSRSALTTRSCRRRAI